MWDICSVIQEVTKTTEHQRSRAKNKSNIFVVGITELTKSLTFSLTSFFFSFDFSHIFKSLPEKVKTETKWVKIVPEIKRKGLCGTVKIWPCKNICLKKRKCR